MKKIVLLILTVITLISCKEKLTKSGNIKINYPENLSKIFDKHGGLDKWAELKLLSFKKGKEEYIVDLHSRKSIIKADNYSIGFNGKNAWLTQKDSLSFRGNKDFYYNLYFYFYAMPFVLADNGIIYEESKPLIFEGKSYPGIKISYKENIGTSPDDNYFLYYNPDTFQMEWLKYSVTFFSKKVSATVHTIRYNDWIDIDGFLLPNSLTWYNNDENGNLTVPDGDPIKFTEQTVSKQKISESIFYHPTE